MATTSHAQAVKSLNKSPGRRRFVFKTFSQRLEDIDIDVYRSLDRVKSEPSEGSSFFKDCLIEWRELNTAEDFISYYEEIMPLVQTLPLVLLHKDTIFSKLLSRLNMNARLSLEPILRLIAALSRDLLEQFLPFLPELICSLISLLESGADREPDIIEQIFSSWSYIMMFLQKYLTRNIVRVLKDTIELRYYPKDYVQEFIAEAMSFLLRNANTPVEQLIKGIRKVMVEIAKEPLLSRKSAVSALLCHTMKGTSLRFHSRAERVLQLLMDKSIFEIGDRFDQGADTILEVIAGAFERICEEFEVKELNLIMDCIYKEISDCITEKNMIHLNRLLSLLISCIEVDHGRKVSDYGPLLEVTMMLVQMLALSHSSEDWMPDVLDNVLNLMIRILHGLNSCKNLSTITSCSIKWAPVFQLRQLSLLKFIRGLLVEDTYTLQVFKVNIISMLDNLMEFCTEEVTYLLLSFCEKMEAERPGFQLLGVTEGGMLGIQSSMRKVIKDWIRLVDDLKHGHLQEAAQVEKSRLALLWGVIRICPYASDGQENFSLLKDFIDALDLLLMIEDDNIFGLSRHTWQSLIGGALSSYYKDNSGGGLEDVCKVMQIVKRNKSSKQVLVAVADYLDSKLGSSLQREMNSYTNHLVSETENAVEAVNFFAENLCHLDKGIRESTLRILCHYEPLCGEIAADNLSHGKEMGKVFPHLLSIEATPLSISTSRKVILSISKLQMDISAGRIHETYALPLLYGMIGVFQNRFSSLWGPTSECLAVLISKHVDIVWRIFTQYFEQCQSSFLASHLQLQDLNVSSSNKSSDLAERFDLFVNPPIDSTPLESLLSLLIQSLQKIPVICEAKSRQLIPIFLKFLGYNDESLSVSSFNSSVCKGKKWKGILKEWLNLLILMRNARSFYQSQFLKEVLQHRLLDENDAEIQIKVLDSLLMWKDDFLLPYEHNLKNLISTKTLREELTTWSLSKESNLIEDSHRAYLVPLVIRILASKVRKLKTLASRKHASVYLRKAVLGFIAELEVNELPLFFALLIKPLEVVSAETNGTSSWYWSSTSISMDDFLRLDILAHCTVDKIEALSLKKIYGFLHVVQDVLGTFDEYHIKVFLNLLMGFVVRILGCCTSGLAKRIESSLGQMSSTLNQTLGEDEEAGNHSLVNMPAGQLKDVRSLCLRIFSSVLNKYEEHDFGFEFWNLFFIAIQSLIEKFKEQGSSSEKPSSLFFCFLAMSRSRMLVSLLYRERNLIPQIFSILTSEKVSEAVVSGVLKFIENLLNLDGDMGEEENIVREILLVNLETLVSSLHSLFFSNSLFKRKLVKCPGGESKIRIFKLLASYVKDQPQLARKFMDILLPFMTKESQNSDFCQEVLQVVKDIIPVLGSDCSTKILNAVSPLLTSVELKRRISICELLTALANVDSSMLLVGKIVHELNAISAMEGGLDYDTVINAYENIRPDFFRSLREDHALLILSHCVYDMSSDEMILRQSAYRSLLAFVDFCAQIVGHDVENEKEMAETMAVHSTDCWTVLSVQQVVGKFLMKHMGDAMKRGSSIKKEWIDLLRNMVLKLPLVANLDSLKPLCSEDIEVDFFYNLVHLQKHRKARALARFRTAISAGSFSEVIMKKVFVPMFYSMLLDVQDGKTEQIRNACVEALASIAAHLEWNSYYALLMRCFREISMDQKQKVVLRLICAILDQFHFSNINLNQVPESFASATSGTLQMCDSSDKIPEVQRCLEKSVLPKVQKLLNTDTEKVNVNINLAALKLLKLLPGGIMDSHLPSIIHRISNFLKSRMESIRDEARSALAACLKELGLDFLQFVLKALRTTLKRGYELHVLGYTLHFLLSKILSNSFHGKLDYCLEDLLSVVENDILGDVSEEKEVEKIASRMKETKKRMSYDTLKLISQNITFRTHALKLLSPLTAHLQKPLMPKLKTKLETMLSYIASGIECNPSVDQTDLFIFVYGLIEDGINRENGLSDGSTTSLASKAFESTMRGKTVSANRVKGKELLTSHIITVFALRLLHTRLKNMKMDRDDEQLLSKLDPFVGLLGNCLSSKYEDILTTSLRCMTPLVRLPLPSLEHQADKIKAAVLDIARNSVSTSSPLMESCLRLLTVLLRSTNISLSSDQLQMLIQFPMFVELDRNPSSVALSLLKAIVHRKIVVHEMYDIITQVGELMVTSQLDSIRKKCSQILLQFLLDYPLTEKRLLQHLNFVLSNLRYEHSTGREAVLEMLHAIIVKFPKKVLDEQSKTIFVDLVLCLVNDNDNKVRQMTGAVIKLLAGHISTPQLHSILEYSMSWYLGEKKQLYSAAAQVLGLLAEVMKKGFQSHISSVLPMMKNIVQSAATAVATNQQDLSEGATLPFWKEAYYSLVMLEKILYQFPHLSLTSELEDVWEAVCELLSHPHTWLWSVSNRLVAFYFVRVTEEFKGNNEKYFGSYYLMRTSRLFLIAASLCCQLKTQLADEATGNLIAENLVFAICGLHSFMGHMDSEACHKYWLNIAQYEQVQYLRAFQLLDPRKGRDIFLYLRSGLRDDIDQSKHEEVQYSPIFYLLKRVGKIAVYTEPAQMKIAFNTIQKVALQFGCKDSLIYAGQLLLPVYKVCEGFSGKVIHENTKQIAQEVSEKLRNTMGIENFVRVYSQIRKSLEGKRDKRKREEKLIAVVDPARNAKRKLRIAAKKRGNKKRKIMSMKMQRWMR